jgi:predicted negative regulator of RcsB-dependent stress response
VSDEKRSEDELDEKDPPAEGGASAASEGETEEDGADLAAANPAEIARRVAALGADDQLEAIAREEERKLAERRAAKKKGKKTGLEAAASKKLAKIGKRAEPRRTVAVAADADPLIERTAKLSDWAKKNQKTVQMVGGLLFVALIAVAGFLYYQNKRETEASAILSKAVEAQTARIGEPPKDEDEETGEKYFKTFDARRDAALKQYRDVQAKFPGTGAAILARLAEGSLLLDKREADAALTAFEEVKVSPLAAADTEVKGRALEGIGFAHELKAQAAPAEKDKHLDAALAAFKELENEADSAKGLKEMAMYHQARVLQNKGDKDKAKELLVSLKERLNKTEEALAPGLPMPTPFPYLKEVAMDRLHEIDPEGHPKSNMTPGGGSMNLSPAQIRKMMEDMANQQQGRDPH